MKTKLLFSISILIITLTFCFAMTYIKR